jgi:hypothetical protein
VRPVVVGLAPLVLVVASAGTAHGEGGSPFVAHPEGAGSWDDVEDDDWRDEEAVAARPVDAGSPSPRRRLSSRWFWSGLLLAALSGGAAVGTGLTTLRLHDAYLADRTDPLLRRRGMELELATNVLLGVTGGLALATLVFAIVAEWPPRRRSLDGGLHHRAAPPTRAFDVAIH